METSNLSTAEIVFNWVTSQPFDCDFFVEGKRIWAHGVVLRAVSPVFDTIFSDQHNLEYRSFTISGMTFNELHAVLEFAYSGTLKVDGAIAEEMKIKLSKLGMSCSIAEIGETKKVQTADKDVTSKRKPEPSAKQNKVASQCASGQSEANKENVENVKTSSPSVAVSSPKWKSKGCKNCKKTFFSARHHRNHENKCKKSSVGSLKKIF